ncbi:hypothetical protein CMU59_11685 [Elizabethkingia anophelis]|nr:hypothetical protein [Elizabethkingia anophelis]MDV3598386.1 hypothetical protein [Elizabethkingia anophelis]MDV3606165.1 hypothetical protein [Elizabethkingia anophelis]MDV3639305.1 hypothetical protein [Elizabethkingia anophelis]MDV3648248.1 hypothetical protein [Elizabethkingia anophelis]
MSNNSIDLSLIKIFKRNTDAIFTNRGFYYQYLSTLKKWITHFIEDIDIPIYTEVENDIKEIGENYVFTQLKCYSTNFSLNSKEIKSSIFNFFITYLKYRQDNISPSFSFVTNSGIKKNEKLLGRWFNREVFNNNKDLDLLKKKNKEILKSESNKIRQSKLNRQNLSIDRKLEINSSYQTFCSILENDLLIEDFCRAINWEFGSQTTEEAINKIKSEILILLTDKAFNGRSTEILFRVLLSEINRCSQETEKSKRCVTNSDLLNLLELTNVDIQNRIDSKFISLIGVEIEELKDRVKNIETIQEKQASEIKKLKPLNLENTDLTLIPYIDNVHNIIGWNNEIEEVYSILNKKNITAIHNFGGVGKTTFIKKFLAKYRNNYNNVIWLNIEKSLHNAFILNDLLTSNLNIELDKEQTIEQQFYTIINELDKHGNNNLIILDIQKNIEDIVDLNKIVSLRNWKKIVVTRNRYKSFNPYLLPKLSFEDAKRLFELHCSQENIDDNIFVEFLEYIDYNNLIIELVAKTIENSFDLTLEFIFDSLKRQNLNNESLKIDIEIPEEETKTIRIFDFLLQKFTIEGLDSNEKYFLEYLSLLPSSNIIIGDLILICGKDYVESNKIYFANVINSLERKGFLQYENTRKSIQIHKILQDSVLYSARDERNPFIMSSRYIAWLTGRLSDGYNSPKESFKFLKYAESILTSIKEEYRSSVYQPLLMLENEYLHLSAFFFIRENVSKLWKDLIKRSEDYLGKDNVALAAMYNNLALSLTPEESIDKIISLLQKSVKIYYKKSDGYKDGDLLMFITTLNNLAQAYLFKNVFNNTIKYFNKVAALRKKYYFYNDAQIGVGYTILSEIFKKTKNFDKSESLMKEAIKYHNLIPSEKRNDFLLSSYYNKLSEYSLLKDNLQDAIIYQQKCIEILESEEIKNSHISSMYQFLIDLYKVCGDFKSATIYGDKLQSVEQNNINCKVSIDPLQK